MCGRTVRYYEDLYLEETPKPDYLEDINVKYIVVSKPWYLAKSAEEARQIKLAPKLTLIRGGKT